MRRRDRELTDPRAVDELLEKARVARLGLADPASPAPLPYVVPVHFAYRAGRIYIHSAPLGKKVEILRRNSRVCLEVDELLGFRPAATACGWSSTYRSLVVFGQARLLDSADQKRAALEALGEKYAGRRLPMEDAEVERVAVVEIRVEEITAKTTEPTAG